MSEAEIDRIYAAYAATFGNALYPFGVDEGRVAEILAEHLARGEPVPDDYDWYPDLPPGAVV